MLLVGVVYVTGRCFSQSIPVKFLNLAVQRFECGGLDVINERFARCVANVELGPIRNNRDYRPQLRSADNVGVLTLPKSNRRFLRKSGSYFADIRGDSSRHLWGQDFSAFCLSLPKGSSEPEFSIIVN